MTGSDLLLLFRRRSAARGVGPADFGARAIGNAPTFAGARPLGAEASFSGARPIDDAPDPDPPFAGARPIAGS